MLPAPPCAGSVTRPRRPRLLPGSDAGVVQSRRSWAVKCLPTHLGGAHETGHRSHSRSGDPRDAFDRQSSDVRLTLPARPENVAVVRHVLGAFAEALELPADRGRGHAPGRHRGLHERRAPRVPDGRARPDRRRRSGPNGEQLEVIVSDQGAGIGPSPDRCRSRPRPAADRSARRLASRSSTAPPAGSRLRDVVPAPAATGARVTRPGAAASRRRRSRSPPARSSARFCAASSACSPRAPTCRSTASTTPCWSPT